jgi:RimJ/RimL family protein N-acetyltransferase
VASDTPDPVAGDIHLRDVVAGDLPIFFDQQLDPDANHMAAFTAGNPADWDAFMARWARILDDPDITKQTILCDGQVAGHVLRYEESGRPEVSYWLGKSYWGRGIATTALVAFLRHVRTRPLYARAAKLRHNATGRGARRSSPCSLRRTTACDMRRAL